MVSGKSNGGVLRGARGAVAGESWGHARFFYITNAGMNPTNVIDTNRPTVAHSYGVRARMRIFCCKTIVTVNSLSARRYGVRPTAESGLLAFRGFCHETARRSRCRSLHAPYTRDPVSKHGTVGEGDVRTVGRLGALSFNL